MGILPMFFALSAFALVAPFCSAATSDPLDSLLKRPLFQPDKSASASSTTAAPPLRVEFGGFLILDGKPQISLTDLTTGQSTFVSLRDPSAPFFVESLDANTPAISLRMNGQPVTLRLRQSTPDSASPIAVATPASATATINDAGVKDIAHPVSPASDSETSGPVPAPNRIPFQSLKIPLRADDPK